MALPSEFTIAIESGVVGLIITFLIDAPYDAIISQSLKEIQNRTKMPSFLVAWKASLPYALSSLLTGDNAVTLFRMIVMLLLAFAQQYINGVTRAHWESTSFSHITVLPKKNSTSELQHSVSFPRNETTNRTCMQSNGNGTRVRYWPSAFNLPKTGDNKLQAVNLTCQINAPGYEPFLAAECVPDSECHLHQNNHRITSTVSKNATYRKTVLDGRVLVEEIIQKVYIPLSAVRIPLEPYSLHLLAFSLIIEKYNRSIIIVLIPSGTSTEFYIAPGNRIIENPRAFSMTLPLKVKLTGSGTISDFLHMLRTNLGVAEYQSSVNITQKVFKSLSIWMDGILLPAMTSRKLQDQEKSYGSRTMINKTEIPMSAIIIYTILAIVLFLVLLIRCRLRSKASNEDDTEKLDSDGTISDESSREYNHFQGNLKSQRL